MNFIKKAYCRVFQTCLWISLPVLPYREPEIIKSMRLIPETIKSQNLTHPIIITDKGIMNLGLVNPLIDALDQAKMPYSLYDGTVANPTTQNVAEALELYKKTNATASSASAEAQAWIVPRLSGRDMQDPISRWVR